MIKNKHTFYYLVALIFVAYICSYLVLRQREKLVHFCRSNVHSVEYNSEPYPWLGMQAAMYAKVRGMTNDVSLKEVEMNTISRLKNNGERLQCIYWPLINSELFFWQIFDTYGSNKEK